MIVTRLLPAAGLLAFAGFLVPAVAQPPAPPAALPVTRVTLSTAGVAHVVREGTLDGPARVELKLPEGDVNDLLKTLLADDPAGPPPSVSLPTPAGAGASLRTFRVNWERPNLSLADLLEQARGEEVTLTPLDGEPVSGTLLGVQKFDVEQVVQEYRNRKGGESPEPALPKPLDDRAAVNVAGEAGVESVPLPKVRRVQFKNPLVQKEFRVALAVLARAGGASDARAVAVTFRGAGKRPVSLSHVSEASLWKPSWRLALGQDKAIMQGWATVENTGDEDWDAVRLSLASGRPMAFTMNQLDPLVVPRPDVEPPLLAGLRPPVYGGQVLPGAGFAGGFAGGLGQTGGQTNVQGRMQNLGVGGGVFGAADFPGPIANPLRRGYEEVAARAALPPPEAPRGPAPAAGADFGRRFQYDVADPVTVPKGQTALVPTLRGEVGAARLSLFNPAVLADHPLLGIRLTNATKQFLAQGPVAVYDGGRYAGDARLPDVEPGESRLLSYAIDLDVEARALPPERLTSVEKIDIRDGHYRVATKDRVTATFRLASRSAEPKVVWVVHPRDPKRVRLEPKDAAETTGELVRFEAKLAPMGAATVTVVEEERGERLLPLLTGLSIDDLAKESARPATPPSVREALAKLRRLRISVAEKTAQVAVEEAAVAAIVSDQGRLRDNIKAAPLESETHRRLVKKLDTQEAELEQRRGRAAQLKAEREALEAEAEAFAKSARAE